MKKIISTLLGVVISIIINAQQTGPVFFKTKKVTSTDIKSTNRKDVRGFDSIIIEQASTTIEKEENPILMLYGVGNFNQESFSSLNSSGKASFLFLPLHNDSNSLRINMSVNKNATNNDSLLASTLLFPEIGNHSFLGTVEYVHKMKNKKFQTDNYISVFAEFAYKKIKIDEKDTIKKTNTTKGFATVNFTIGSKITFAFQNKEFSGSFSFVPYLSYFNIPDEDQDDFRYVSKRNFKFINNNELSDHFTSLGLKTIFEINAFQIFADFRHVLRNDNVSAVELRGLKANIGVVFNANILTARL
jgi:hypothetical protein